MLNKFKSNPIYKYAKIYLAQVISLLLNITSLLIVIPYISTDKELFGIYSLCISLTIFLSYADLGFLSSGMKYSSEKYAAGLIKQEIEITAFSSFVLWILSVFFSVFLVYVSTVPTLLVSNIDQNVQHITSQLLLTVAIYAQFIVLSRFVLVIYSIRMKQYIFQVINIFGNMLKIIGVFYFFGSGNYRLVDYFIFITVVSVIVLIVSIYFIPRSFPYSLKHFFKNFRFSRKTYDKTKTLAFSSLLISLSWIAYYEMDSVVITKLFDPLSLALYSLGLTFLSLFRNIYSLLYSPFISRFNHYKGRNELLGLQQMVLKIIAIGFPFFLIPIVTTILFLKPVIIFWVGVDYINSIIPAQFLILSIIFGFINYPIGILLNVQEKTRIISRISLVLPLIYWVTIYFLFDSFNIAAFAFAKCFIFFLLFSFYLRYAVKYLEIKNFSKLTIFLWPTIESLLTILLLYVLIEAQLPPYAKSNKGLFITVCSIVLVSGISLIVYARRSFASRSNYFPLLNILKYEKN